MNVNASEASPGRGFGGAFLILLEAVRLVWGANPRLVASALAVQVAAGLGVTAQLLLAQHLLEALTHLDPAHANIRPLAPSIVALVLITMGLGIATFAETAFMRLLAENTVRHVNQRIMAVSSAVDLESFERPAFFDHMQRALKNGVSAPIDIASALTHMVAAGLGVFGILGALAAIQPLLVPMVLLGYAPVWIASTRNSLALFTFEFGHTANDRARAYLQQVLTGRETAKEVRAFALFGFLSERWTRLYGERMASIRILVREQLRRSIVASTVTSLLLAATFGVLVALWLGGSIGLAGGATAAIALQQLGARLQVISQQANTLYESGLFLENYTSFLKLGSTPAERTGSVRAAPRGFSRLTVHNVSYTYPGGERPALDDVSMEFRSGEVIALVGENGSGKTTLAKLLCGLYPPKSGEILWDGVDIRDHDPEAIRRSIAVIFQEFARYQLSVWDNLAVGDTTRADDRAGMEAAARAAKAHAFLATLANGYDTMLSPQFEGGVDLSLGQWQRVAIARAFFRDAPFLVLDEPTAALDAKAESELFTSIQSLSNGRTVLLISHRFSSVRSADRIYVLHEGKIVETGSHGALMSKRGRYADMFTLQASNYVDSPHQIEAGVPG
jgi:ATP-binding cassette, subfamily B, bacterial